MGATSFLIAHGEKLAVLLVAGSCGCVLWNTFTDPSYRPKDDAQHIEDINRSIAEAFKTQKPPVMNEPRNYLEELQKRTGLQVPVTPTMSWLTTLPDMGKDKPGSGAFIYVYELLAPSVKAKDVVGQLQITLTPPEAGEREGNGRRISSAADVTWSRTSDKASIINHARHLGLQVQVKVDKGEWQPLVLPGASKEGVLPLDGLSTEPVLLPALEPWQNHAVRARLIAAATALDFNTSVERPLETVVVFPGRISTGPTDDERVISALTSQLGKHGGDLRDQALLSVDGPLPAKVTLETNERLFLGPWSPVDADSSPDITGNVRCALVGVSSEPLKDDPSKTREVGKFLLLKLFQQGGESKWLDKPLEMKYGVGDRLGEDGVKVPNPFSTATPKPLIPINLSTPFVIQALNKDKRVLYWTIKAKARSGGGKDRDLGVDKKEVPTEIVVLKNPDTGSELVLTKLIPVTPPAGTGLVVYPYRATAQNEREDFVKAPSEFKQWGLVPEEPKPHDPGTGPLEKLHQDKTKSGDLEAGIYTTDTVYFELGDSRLVWWDAINHLMRTHDPKGVEKPAGSVPEVPAVPPTGPTGPTGPKPPVGPKMPPGMPRGMPPGGPGGMPPGMPGGMPPGMPGTPPKPPQR